MTKLYNTNRFDKKLWIGFLTLAQPYWFPLGKHSALITLGLLSLLLLFVGISLFLLVTAFIWISHSLFPHLTEQIAPGLFKLLNQLMTFPSLYLIASGIIIPVLFFIFFRKSLIARWQPWILLALLLFLSLAVSGLNVIISYVSRFFQTDLANRDIPGFWRFLWVYFSVFVVGIPITVYFNYVQSKLSLYWREWMTYRFLERYFQNKAYYTINNNDTIDNPDQRISEDINSFTNYSLSFLLVVLNSIISLISFIGILWSISVTLVFLLVAYTTVGTIFTVILGKRLVWLNFNQLQQEANFRYSLVHIRNNTESIAFYRGEEQEFLTIKQRFIEVLKNFNLLIGWQKNLGFFTTAYGYLNVILPSLIVAPLYFAHKIDFGAITQAGFAFDQVLGAMSLIVNQFDSLTTFVAGIHRLEGFQEAIAEPSESQRVFGTTLDVRIDNKIKLEHVTLQTPNYGKKLVRNLSFELPSGQGLLIMGSSGSGKSSLLRAIAGLWNSGTGLLVRPPLSEMLFLPQRPYMPLGSLRQQLLYPQTSRNLTEKELYGVLQLVNLEDLPERVGGFDTVLNWADIFSLGEQQRLAFARLLLSAPPYAILDEATSALDVQNEAKLYHLLRTTQTTFISVGHRSSLIQYHDVLLELDGQGDWQLLPCT